MTNLYSILETNTDITKNQDTEKFKILMDLKGNSYKISDTYTSRNIICVCGSCDLLLENNDEKAIVTLDNHKTTIHIDKNVKAELKNYTEKTRVFIQYLGEVNE